MHTLLTCSLGAALLLTIATTSDAQRREPGPPPVTAKLTTGPLDLPMETYGGRPLVKVTINGSGPYDFILDTGASLTVLDNGLAAELELPDLGKAEIGSPAGGTVPTMKTRIDRMEIGSAVISASTAEAMDLAGYFRTEGAPRGVLSAAHFKGLLLTFDYPGERIVLREGALDEPDGLSIVAYEQKDRHIWVPITVAGKTMQAHLDTGAPSTLMLPLELSKEVAFESEPVVSGKARLVGREMEVRTATLDGAMQIGPRTIERPMVTILDGPPVANVGRGAIETFAVTIDQANERIEFAESKHASKAKASSSQGPQRIVRMGGPAAGGGAQRMVRHGGSSKKRYGIHFTGIEGEVLEVIGVESGSPAEQAGLEAGDRILEINGKSIGSMSSEACIAALRGSPLKLIVERGGERVGLALNLD